ncbi:MAG: tetratricopeptide repeat protein [Acidobacteriota bacterium]
MRRTRSLSWVAVLVALTLVGRSLGAMFVQPLLDSVPIDRLIVNLEKLSRDTPADVALRLNIARAHSMAYAYKTNTAQIQRGNEKLGVWTGHEPSYTQFAVKKAADAAAEQIARGHLDQAIARYREIIALAPAGTAPQSGFPARLDLVAQLGLGWCLTQAGERDAAIAQLRKVVETSSPLEDSRRMLVFQGQRSLTEEAIRYLVPLLDPDKDRQEITALRDRASQLATTVRPITPIAVPLREDLTALEITDYDAGVLFDADGSGIARRWTWITPDAGWLVYDQRGTRQIDSALQMFGSVSFWLFWENGYRALRALDDDGDRRLAGPELTGLAIWRDRNGNGRSESGEVRPLGAWHIVSLSCDYEIDPTHPDEIVFSPAGVTFRDGSTRPTFDIVLHRHGS